MNLSLVVKMCHTNGEILFVKGNFSVPLYCSWYILHVSNMIKMLPAENPIALIK